MQDTRSRTSTKRPTVESSKLLRLKALVLGGNAIWIGVFWPLFVAGSARTLDIMLASSCTAFLLLGTLTGAPQPDPKASLGITLPPLWRGVCLLVAYPTSLALAMACRPEAQNLRIFGPLTLSLLGVSLCAYGAFAAQACAVPAETMIASHVALGDPPHDALSARRGGLQALFIGVCVVGAWALVFIAPAWGGASALNEAWGDAAMAGGVLTAVVGTALSVTTLTLFMSSGLRKPSTLPPRSGTALRATWFLFLALLGAVTYFVIRP